ncbi:putative phosphoglycerate mutase [Nocardioides luteus]|uniref:Fructose 1,6-bisphosphatase n=1 Tax=Nocardioides luteus TaxID=1844 RepID=A0ABQ5T0A7_9ACTN|nr:histidine phosphatase family protein [Nocardioides luteus]MDR7312880.1 putative phosphoglycerate mutase [Nocardioides luteus]GGR48212.1 fructose 1,6-bisphosphatase [Nocardioides luteus]GLJ69134.1 fructose 1,6-bisphosphatase [Nocardioides luteus]
MRLLLIRHGQTPSNVSGALDTAFPGAGLTELGQSQAAAVPDALAGENIAGLYASRLVRTQLTAAPLAERLGLPVVVQEGFEEINAGDLEMATDKQAVTAYLEALGDWIKGTLETPVPGGEAGHEFLARFDAAVQTVVKQHGPDDTVAIVSHGAAIRMWTGLRTTRSPAFGDDNRIRNTGLATIEGSPEEGWETIAWNNDPLGGAHLIGEGF